MVQATNRLSARFVETVTVGGKYADGGNLYLIVAKGGGKSWLFIYRFGGRQREAGLGSLERVSLKAARGVATQYREMLGGGVDPLEKRAADARVAAVVAAASAAERERATFGEFALRVLDGYTALDAKGKEKRFPGKKEGYRNAKHAAQWESTLREYAAPLWSMSLESIEVEDVFKCVAPYWITKNETARRVRGRIEAILSAAIVHRLRKGPNPAVFKDNLAAILPRVEKLQRGHHPALPWRNLPDFWKKLAALESISARALAFTILTAARSGETRGAIWRELDLERAVWTVPAERMKARKEHTVPLSVGAMSIIDEVAKLRRTGSPDELLFPSVRDRRPLSDMALSMCLRGIQTGVTVHGFRSSFRDWCGDATDYPRELAEQSLAHTVGGVEGAYRRGDALEKRRLMMNHWATLITLQSSE